MNWFEGIVITHSVVILVLLGLSVSISLKRGKSVNDWAVLSLLLSFIGWISFDIFSRLDRNVYNDPANTLGSIAGIMVQWVAFSSYFLGEVFPTIERFTRWAKVRITFFAICSLLIAPWTFHPLWITRITNDDGSFDSILGPLYTALSSYACLLALIGLGLVAYRYFNAKDLRQRLHMQLFLWGGLATFVMVTVFSFILPVYGIGEYFFLGPDASLLLMGVLTYSMLRHQLFDVRTATLRILIRLIFSVISGVLVYGIFWLWIVEQGLASVSVQLVVLLSLLFLVGMQFGKFFQRIDTWLFQDWPGADDILLSLLDQRHLGDNLSMRIVLNDILKKLQGTLQFQKGFLMTRSRDGLPLVFSVGEVPPGLEAVGNRILLRLLSLNAWPNDMLPFADNTFILDSTANQRSWQAIRDRFPRMARSLREMRSLYNAYQFAVVIPLIYQKQINGFLVLGQKRNGLPYFSDNIKVLQAIRVSMALAIRNISYHEEVKSQKARAQAEAAKLTEVLNAREIIHKNVDDRTLVYKSSAVASIIENVDQASKYKRPVLIHGETGTGKELFARLIHSGGVTLEHPFVAVNAATIPASIWEDEIFGHKKGAFTDAHTARIGKVAQAGHGTLFLDEIGEMPLEMQAKMLRLLQENVYYPLGAEKPQESYCRFIFATNRDLLEMVRDGLFREDLYYRINVFQIELPPLRDRREDIQPLLEFYLEKFVAELNSNVKGISKNAIGALARYNWPGNIRELENLLLRAIAGCKTDTLELDDFAFPDEDAVLNLARDRRRRGEITRIEEPDQYEDKVDAYRKMLIQQALKISDGNKTQAAQILGIKRGKLLYQIKELDVEPN